MLTSWSSSTCWSMTRLSFWTRLWTLSSPSTTLRKPWLTPPTGTSNPRLLLPRRWWWWCHNYVIVVIKLGIMIAFGSLVEYQDNLSSYNYASKQKIALNNFNFQEMRESRLHQLAEDERQCRSYLTLSSEVVTFFHLLTQEVKLPRNYLWCHHDVMFCVGPGAVPATGDGTTSSLNVEL